MLVLNISLYCVMIWGAVAPDDGEIKKAPPPRQVEFTGGHDDGIVTAVAGDSITVSRPGQPPKRFSVCVELATGGFRSAIESEMYRLVDVQVGDTVRINYRRVGGVDRCDAISIRRRPEGKIPPSQETGNFVYRHHERMQAYQDWEEKGVALPAKYASGGRFLNPPYPPEAPTPRCLGPWVERADSPPDPTDLRKSWSLAQAKSIELLNGDLEGTVTAVGDGWLLIRPDGGVAKRFLVSDALAAGRVPEGSARPSDVRAGDVVKVWYDRFDGESVFREIRITKRQNPVPPSKD